jgi:hypothetical protein
MKIKDGFMLRKFGDDFIVVAVGDDADNFNKLITLNSVGAFIYEKLSKDTSADEVVNAIVDRYDVDKATAENDTMNFLANVRKAGLLDE